MWHKALICLLSSLERFQIDQPCRPAVYSRLFKLHIRRSRYGALWGAFVHFKTHDQCWELMLWPIIWTHKRWAECLNTLPQTMLIQFARMRHCVKVHNICVNVSCGGSGWNWNCRCQCCGNGPCVQWCFKLNRTVPIYIYSKGKHQKQHPQTLSVPAKPLLGGQRWWWRCHSLHRLYLLKGVFKPDILVMPTSALSMSNNDII